MKMKSATVGWTAYAMVLGLFFIPLTGYAQEKKIQSESKTAANDQISDLTIRMERLTTHLDDFEKNVQQNLTQIQNQVAADIQAVTDTASNHIVVVSVVLVVASLIVGVAAFKSSQDFRQYAGDLKVLYYEVAETYKKTANELEKTVKDTLAQQVSRFNEELTDFKQQTRDFRQHTEHTLQRIEQDFKNELASFRQEAQRIADRHEMQMRDVRTQFKEQMNRIADQTERQQVILADLQAFRERLKPADQLVAEINNKYEPPEDIKIYILTLLLYNDQFPKEFRSKLYDELCRLSEKQRSGHRPSVLAEASPEGSPVLSEPVLPDQNQSDNAERE